MNELVAIRYLILFLKNPSFVHCFNLILSDKQCIKISSFINESIDYLRIPFNKYELVTEKEIIVKLFPYYLLRF